MSNSQRYQGLGSANSGLQSQGPQRASTACRLATLGCVASTIILGLFFFRFPFPSSSFPPHPTPFPSPSPSPSSSSSTSSSSSSSTTGLAVPNPLPETIQNKCAAAAKALRQRSGWDYMRVMRKGQASKDSVAHLGSLARLAGAIQKANDEKRPLKIAVLGGSFSAGGAVADMEDSYPEVLASLLAGRDTDSGEGPVPPSPILFGAEIVNMAQGGAGFMLPLFCTMKVYSLVAEQPERVPDVWVVEFGENFDSTLDQYEALLAMLLLDHARFRSPAVLTVAVAKNFCWWSDGPIRAAQCGLQRTWGWLKAAAKTMDVPLISFVHGVAPWVDYVPPAWALEGGEEEEGEGRGEGGARTLPGLLLGNGSELHKSEFPGLYEKLDRVGKQLYANCGENQHFNEYGHRLLGNFLYSLFGEAAREGVGEEREEEERRKEEGAVRARLSTTALEVFERVSSGSSGHTVSCNLTLTQGRALDLVPVARSNYTLWTEKAEGSSDIFSGGKKKRSDRKQTWSPLSENATLDFDSIVPIGASTLCVLMYGSQGMYLNASFPEYPTRMVEEVVEEEVEEDEEGGSGEGGKDGGMVHEKERERGEDGLCRQVQPNGKIKVVMCDSSSNNSSSKRNKKKENDASTPSTTSLRAGPSIRSGKPTGSVITGEAAASPLKKKGTTKTRLVAQKRPDGSPYLLLTDSTCEYRGGVDWTIYSVYKIDCGCSLPQAMADGKMHRIQLKNTRGKVQVAGLVIW